MSTATAPPTSPSISTSSPKGRRRDFVGRYGPWAVVTGASSGIGRAIALELAATGCHLVLLSRGGPALDAVAASARAHGVQVETVACDLSLTDGVEELIQATSERETGLFVASAGFGTSGTFADGDVAAELSMIDVNVRALCAQTHHFANVFRDRGRGGIVLLSSIVGYQGMPNAANYAATKAYVQSLAEGLRSELAPHGVDVLAAAPGPTDSGFAGRAGMRMGGALAPEKIAWPILRSLGSTTTVLPGSRSKLLRLSLAPLPRRMRVAIMGAVMKGMTRPGKATEDDDE
jgi:short-subunit dehydrogenase